MIYELIETGRASALFAGWQDSVVWSALQGVMGKIYVDSLEKPESGVVMLGDFCFLSGKPESEIISGALTNSASEEVILVPQNDDWAQMIVECYGEKAEKAIRYAIKKEPGIFDLKQLQKVAQSLPGEYEMRLIDQELFEICRDTQWSKDLTANYESYSQYKEYGLGVCILTGGEVVAGISSYSGYGRRSDENLGCHGGIEIEVVTREDYRRKGLAYIGAAQLLLECDKRGLYPNWDAANKMSVGLAEKLGYHFSHEYVVYKVKK
ncbi:MAG: GNAT family N-acetyltransferase [Ruminococcus sp.]